MKNFIPLLFDLKMNESEWVAVLPSKEEKRELQRKIQKIINELEKFVSETGVKAKIVPVGSTAKDTFLKGSSDIDIFIVSDSYQDLFNLVKYFKPSGKVKRGELLIWNYRDGTYDVDLVFVPPKHPRIETLKHTEFYNKHLTDKMRDEVRKAKAFFRSHGVYKAEIGGITGVAIEELIRQKKTFENLCRYIASHDLEDVWLQDPTTTRPRNLLASINKTRWKQAQEACRKYLKTGEVDLKPFSEEDFRWRYNDWTIVKCERKYDTATDYHTALSLCNKAGNQTKSREYDITFFCDSYVENHILIALRTEPSELSKYKEVCIPEKLTEAIEHFKRTHPEAKTYRKDGQVCALIKRSITNPEKYMTEQLIERMQKRGYECIVEK